MRRWIDARQGWILAAIGLVACRGGGGTVSPSEARCRRLCEASYACEAPPGEAGELHIECFTSCDDLEALNRVNECHDEVDSFYDCIEKHGTCSDLDVVCEEQQAVYSDCLADPCSTDPERDVCL
ncbi:MAG TPA: hypothetical protein VE093_34370 [Polyangiaceae bacterium]|jgi:hypothetical protein|nr:hypothetical protein [Polyangiaceae bacterium]